MRSYRKQEACRIFADAIFPSLACMLAYPFVLTFLSLFMDLSPDPFGIPRYVAALLFPVGAAVLAFASAIPEPDMGPQASVLEMLASALYNGFSGGIIWSFVWGVLFGIGAMPKAFLVAGTIYGGFCLALLVLHLIFQSADEIHDLVNTMRQGIATRD